MKYISFILGVAALAAVGCSANSGSFADKQPQRGTASTEVKQEVASGDATASEKGHGACAPDANLSEHPECAPQPERKPVAEKKDTPVVAEQKPTDTVVKKEEEKKPEVPAATPKPSPSASPAAATTRSNGMLKLAADKVGGKDVWEFTIAAGTAANAWNTEANALDVRIGEVLRIKTAEAGHGLHTGGSPCRHGGNRQFDANGVAKTFSSTAQIDVGGYFECDVTAAVNTTAAGASGNVVYDHTKGQGTRIYIIAK